MQQKLLITILSIALLISFLSLSWIGKQASDPNEGKNWWALSFQDPHGDNLNFVIENHSDSTNFTYTVTYKNQIAQQKSIDLPKGESKTVNVTIPFDPENKTTITVRTNKDDVKEIYK